MEHHGSANVIRCALITFNIFLLIILYVQWSTAGTKCGGYQPARTFHRPAHETGMASDRREIVPVSRFANFTVITGFPGSGLSLLKVIFDSHPNLWCLENSNFGTMYFNKVFKSFQAPIEKARLKEARIFENVTDSASTAFLLELLSSGFRDEYIPGKSSYCIADSLLGLSMSSMTKYLPNVKFILISRDPRQAHISLKSGNVNLPPSMAKSKPATGKAFAENYIKTVSDMLSQCDQVGSEKCFKTSYEALVLRPEATLRSMLNFMSVEWSDNVLHHQDFVGTEIHLDRAHPQSKKLVKPINSGRINTWQKASSDWFGDAIMKHLSSAPAKRLMDNLGYSDSDKPQDFGEADSISRGNDKLLADSPDAFDISHWLDDPEEFYLVNPVNNGKRGFL